MRLDKFTIGSTKVSPTHQFKNLKNVTIDFDEEHWVTVMIGWNGTGKSNVLEALAIIFREMIHSKKPKIDFAFKLAYRMSSGDATRHILLDADPDRGKEIFIIHVASNNEAQGKGTLVPFIEGEDNFSALRGKQIKFSEFKKNGDLYLPKYVFCYYSGESTRMHEVFRPYLESYDKKLRNAEDPGLKRLFYAMPVHSQFVLLAFLIQQTDVVREFLDDLLGLDPDEGIESVLFVLRQPPWKSKAPDGDPRFWNARGIVSDFLVRLYEISLAPIQVKRTVPVSLWNEKELEFQYLYVKDIASLRKLVGNETPAQFFRDLESTYVSELIDEVRIKVRLKKNDGAVTFRELSEGEQQLLTVLGLLRFTAEEESLFLLDEPDTHLNPRWCVDYLRYLKKFVGDSKERAETSHIVLTTHNPLAVAELVKEQVQILYKEPTSRHVFAQNPALNPKGMGYAGIVTSDMFGLGSTLDKETNEDLIKLHRLASKSKLTDEERAELQKEKQRLGLLDFNFASRDRLEQEYLRARFDLVSNESFADAIVTPENKKLALEVLMQFLLQSLQEDKK